MEDLQIGQGMSLLETTDGLKIIGIFSNYAFRRNDRPTIHSKGQMEANRLLVNDRTQAYGGNQCVIMQEGYVIPLHIHSGLPYLNMKYTTDTNIDTYPHVFMTSDAPWDPTTINGEFDEFIFQEPDIARQRREAANDRTNEFGEVHSHQAQVNRIVSFCTHVATSIMFSVSYFGISPVSPSSFARHRRVETPFWLAGLRTNPEDTLEDDSVLPCCNALPIPQALQVSLSCCECQAPSRVVCH